MSPSLRFKEAVSAALNHLDDQALESLASTIERYVDCWDDMKDDLQELQSIEPGPIAESSVAGRQIASEPTAESVREAFDRLVESELANFADNLETARLVYSKYPKLVMAKRWPARLRAAFVAHRKCEPEVNIDIGSPVIARSEPCRRVSRRGLSNSPTVGCDENRDSLGMTRGS